MRKNKSVTKICGILIILTLVILTFCSCGGEYAQKGVCAPVLKTGMTAVVFNDKTSQWEEAKLSDDWYSYSENDKRWANAMTQDGSMWVWIPRFEYQIVPDSGTVGASPDGTINIKFIDVTQTTADEGYTIHPAFTADVDNGGWDSELSGFWVAKFEMSLEENGVNSDMYSAADGNGPTSDTIKMVSKPGAYSWTYINIANAYYNCLNYDTSAGIDSSYDSHLMKNSEWGAVAYLSDSVFGIGNENIKGSDTLLTGGETASVSYIENTDQTSTGTIYGIYDLSGGNIEMVAAFNNAFKGTVGSFTGIKYNYYTDSSYLPTGSNGSVHFASYKGVSTKYATAYTNPIDESHLTNGVYKPGDATYEVYSGDSYNGWGGSFIVSVDLHVGTFFYRGGDGDDNSCLFKSNRGTGAISPYSSFRAVLCPVQ
jgi:hypothetical protein